MHHIYNTNINIFCLSTYSYINTITLQELKDVDNNAEITLKVSPLTSAYKAHQGVEPNMTNWGQTQESPPFIGTLDYIFLSEEWSVAGVSKLPTIEEGLVGPLPTEDEPSDHLLLSADLKL